MADTRCRVCLRDKAPYCSVWEFVPEEDARVRDMIAALCEIYVHEDDPHPKQVCFECFRDLKRAYGLRRRCRNTERKLKTQTPLNTQTTPIVYTGIKIKEESPDDPVLPPLEIPSNASIKIENADLSELAIWIKEEIDEDGLPEAAGPSVPVLPMPLKQETDVDVLPVVASSSVPVLPTSLKRETDVDVLPVAAGPSVPVLQTPLKWETDVDVLSELAGPSVPVFLTPSKRETNVDVLSELAGPSVPVFPTLSKRETNVDVLSELAGPSVPVFPTPSKRETDVNVKPTPVGRRFACNKCYFASKSQERLDAHMAKHKGTPIYTCNVCDFTTNWNSGMINHMQLHQRNGY